MAGCDRALAGAPRGAPSVQAVREPDAHVHGIAERLVARCPAAAERIAVAQLVGAAVGADQGDSPAHVQRAAHALLGVLQKRDRGIQLGLVGGAVGGVVVHEPPGGAVRRGLYRLFLQALVARELGERPHVAVLAVAEAREGAAVVVEQVRACNS